MSKRPNHSNKAGQRFGSEANGTPSSSNSIDPGSQIQRPISPSEVNSAVFVRDLPFHCKDADLKAFLIGKLEGEDDPIRFVQVRYGLMNWKTMQVAVVVFRDEEIAQKAIAAIQEQPRFAGRDIRLQRYDPGNAPGESSQKGALHVSFRGLNREVELITEAVLRELFETEIGPLHDVCIRFHRRKSDGIQFGNGFITFVEEAHNELAVLNWRQTTLGPLEIDCKRSKAHQSEDSQPPFQDEAIGASPMTSAPVNPPILNSTNDSGGTSSSEQASVENGVVNAQQPPKVDVGVRAMPTDEPQPRTHPLSYARKKSQNLRTAEESRNSAAAFAPHLSSIRDGNSVAPRGPPYLPAPVMKEQVPPSAGSAYYYSPTPSSPPFYVYPTIMSPGDVTGISPHMSSDGSHSTPGVSPRITHGIPGYVPSQFQHRTAQHQPHPPQLHQGYHHYQHQPPPTQPQEHRHLVQQSQPSQHHYPPSPYVTSPSVAPGSSWSYNNMTRVAASPQQQFAPHLMQTMHNPRQPSPNPVHQYHQQLNASSFRHTTTSQASPPFVQQVPPYSHEVLGGHQQQQQTLSPPVSYQPFSGYPAQSPSPPSIYQSFDQQAFSPAPANYAVYHHHQQQPQQARPRAGSESYRLQPQMHTVNAGGIGASGSSANSSVTSHPIQQTSIHQGQSGNNSNLAFRYGGSVPSSEPS